MASSSSSSSQKSFEVFLSFRGEDTRHGFTAHLYDALRRRGISTFIDDEDLKRGRVISPALVQAIENSMSSIVVLSENYASSRWCLEELVKILECMDAGSLTVFPIFYKVDPSDVRKQRGSFGEAFVEHEKNSKERVKTWREALNQVANLSGWDSRNRHEPSIIKEVVSDVFNRLLAIASSDAGDLVGIDSHIRKMESLLSAGSNDVRIIGIWGMGGIGKTTIARAVYEQISKQFEACCFLSNVREDSEKHGLVQLQKELLSQLLEEGKISISTVDIGLAFIKTRLCFKKVLIVLDDAHNLQQLEYLAGKHDWFGPGSRIIITTRDVHLLNKVGVNGVYEVVNLNNNDAVTLFSRHAFKKDHPTEDYMELSNYAVSYAKGLPLALKVLGSFLFSKSKLEWKSQLDKLKMNPYMDIESVLRVSFDGLDDTEQDIFLDVACFFRGEDKDYVIKILDSCGFYPDIGIRVLIDKALITVVDNKLWMHDLLQEMGWDIVRKTSHKNPSKRRRLDPGKRSRLWLQEDVYDVLTEKTATENIEGIFLNLHGLKEVQYTTEAFAEMKKLRLLKVYNSHNSEGFECASRKENYKKPFSQDFEFPSNKLRYLYWHRCPLKSLPSNFHPKNLVELNLCYCYVEELWKGVKHMEKLEFIDLSHSQYLVRTPDFSGIPNLERLILEGCTDLREVHQSLGVLSKLIFLNLKDCKNLQHFPSSIGLESLKVLILSGCSKFDKFPEILGYMPNLLELHLNGTAITELPSSIGYATQLVSMDMENCKRFKSLPCCICKLKSLKILKLSGCAKFESFPEILENMEGLRELFLDGTAVKELPLSVEHLNGLVLLNLRNCERLITLPSSICNLKSLSTLTLSGCSQLENLPENLGNLECLVKLEADGTAIIQPPSSIVLLRNLEVLSFQGCNGSPSGLWNSRFWSMLCLRKSSDSTGFRLPPLSGLCSLKQLNLSDCNIKEGALPNDLGGYLSSLEDLNLKGNDFVTLPTGISKLCNLRTLYLRCCKRLQELPMLPPNINRIDAQNCTSLETLSGISAPCWLAFTNSFKQNWGQRTYLAEVSRIPKFNTYLPGNGIPEWFSNQCMGDSINIQLPSHWYNDNFLGFAMCIVFVLKEPNQCRRGAMLCELESSDLEPSILGCFLDHIVWEGHSNGDGFVESDHLWLGYHPNFLIKKDDMDWPNKLSHIKASFVITGIPHEVKWCGFRLVYMEDLNDNNSKITKCSPLPNKSGVVLQDLDESARKDTIIHDEYYNDEGGPSGSLCSNKDLLTCHEAKPKKSSVVLQDLDESATKDTIIHDEGGPSGSLCSNKDLLTCHEAKPEESKTLVRNCWNAFVLFGLICFILGMGVLAWTAIMRKHSFLKCE